MKNLEAANAARWLLAGLLLGWTMAGVMLLKYGGPAYREQYPEHFLVEKNIIFLGIVFEAFLLIAALSAFLVVFVLEQVQKKASPP